MKVLFLAGFVAVALTGCANLRSNVEPPNVVLDSLQLLPSEGLSQKFNIGLTMSNPNDRALKINGIAYTLAVNGYKLLSGVGNNIPEVAAYSQVQFDVQASTNMIEALRLINTYIGSTASDQFDYHLQAKIAVAGLPRKLTVEETGKVPLFSGAD